MGRFLKGVHGGFSGRIGNIIGSKWKGIDYMRSLSDRRNKKSSERQIVQRAKFAFGMAFLQPLFPVINIGYRNHDSHQVPQNAAMRQVLLQVVDGEYPNFRINYAAFAMAQGSLPTSNRESVVVANDVIEFSWENRQNELDHYGGNRALLLAIGEGLYPSYSLVDFTRSNLGGVLPLPSGSSGSVVHCYLAFYDTIDSGVSNSKYVGSVVIP